MAVRSQWPAAGARNASRILELLWGEGIGAGGLGGGGGQESAAWMRGSERSRRKRVSAEAVVGVPQLRAERV